MVIEKERIFTENSNRAHGFGNLNLATFEPFPKNPTISKVCREIGFADELGSGMRNTYKYTRLYSGAEPQFVKGDIFRTISPLAKQQLQLWNRLRHPVSVPLPKLVLMSLPKSN